MPPQYRAPTAPTRREVTKAADLRRGSARERGYTTAWDKASAGHLRNDPLCRYCDLAGDTTPATLTDHLYPHKGQQWLFWLKLFWVSCCTPCHNKWKQKIERLGLLALDDLALRLDLPTLADHLAQLKRDGRDPRV